MDLIQCKEEHSLNMFLYSKKKHQQVVQQCALIAFEKGESLVPTDFNEYDMMNYFGTKHLEEFLAKYELFNSCLFVFSPHQIELSKTTRRTTSFWTWVLVLVALRGK